MSTVDNFVIKKDYGNSLFFEFYWDILDKLIKRLSKKSFVFRQPIGAYRRKYHECKLFIS